MGDELKPVAWGERYGTGPLLTLSLKPSGFRKVPLFEHPPATTIATLQAKLVEKDAEIAALKGEAQVRVLGAAAIVNEYGPRWWNWYVREHPRSMASAYDLRKAMAVYCVEASLARLQAERDGDGLRRLAPTILKAAVAIEAKGITGKVVIGGYGDVPAVEFRRIAKMDRARTALTGESDD